MIIPADFSCKSHTSLCNGSTEIIEGLPGVLGNKGTLAKYPREQGYMSLYLGNWGTKLYKLEEGNIVSKFITRGTNTENVWEHGNIGQFWKGTREQGTPLGDPHYQNKEVKVMIPMSSEKIRVFILGNILNLLLLVSFRWNDLLHGLIFYLNNYLPKVL